MIKLKKSNAVAYPNKFVAKNIIEAVDQFQYCYSPA